MRRIGPIICMGSLLVLACQPSFATLFTGVGTGAWAGLEAEALFEVDSGNLIVTLTNTSEEDVLAPSDVLTALFFDLPGAPTLTRTSGLLASGSTVWFDPDGQPAGGVVGGEFAYLGGLSGAPGGAKYGISSSGFGLFGPGDLFPGPNLDPPECPDGINYGITSAGDNPSTGNAAVTGGNNPSDVKPLIKNSVVFTLGGAGSLDPGKIANVSFQYGTALGEPNISNIPEPASCALLALALGGVGAALKRRKK